MPICTVVPEKNRQLYYERENSVIHFFANTQTYMYDTHVSKYLMYVMGTYLTNACIVVLAIVKIINLMLCLLHYLTVL